MKKKIFAFLGIGLLLGLTPIMFSNSNNIKENVSAASIDGYSYKESKNWIDLDVPFENHELSLSGAQRLGEGAYQISFQGGWGKRIYSLNEYDASNINISLNASNIQMGNTLIMTLLPYNLKEDYVTNKEKYFHMEVVHTNENEYLIVLGDHTCDHNISTPGFKTHSYGAYEGRKITNITDGNIYIQISTDYERNKFNLNINDGLISYTCNSDVMFKGISPKERVNAYLNMSLLGNTEIRHDIIFSKIFSPDIKDKSYINGRNYSIPFFLFECKKEDIFEINFDGDEIENEVIDFNDNKFSFKAKYLNTLPVGNHKVNVRYTLSKQKYSIEWNLKIYSNLTPQVPSTSKEDITRFKDDTSLFIIDINIDGAHPSEISISCNTNILTELDYSFCDYNTKIVFSSSLVSSLNVGINIIRITRNNVNGFLLITLTIIENL